MTSETETEYLTREYLCDIAMNRHYTFKLNLLFSLRSSKFVTKHINMTRVVVVTRTADGYMFEFPSCGEHGPYRMTHGSFNNCTSNGRPRWYESINMIFSTTLAADRFSFDTENDDNHYWVDMLIKPLET